MFKSLSVAVLAVVLTSCVVAGRYTGTSAGSDAAASAQGSTQRLPGHQPSGARRYRIDEHQSELRVLVYRSGPLARLGHNHVIVNRALQGSVSLANEPTASSFSLSIPVAAFLVDNAEARSQEGPEFPGEIPEDAKTGTLHNMLGTALLDADEFPSIKVDSMAVTVGKSGWVASLVLAVVGHESRIEAPFTLTSDANRLSATGSFDLRQSDIGLAPLSLMLGALQVQDTVRVKFTLVAVAN